MDYLIVIYIYVAIFLGLTSSRFYRVDEKNKIFGPIFLGVFWFIWLPLLPMAIRPPPWRNNN